MKYLISTIIAIFFQLNVSAVVHAEIELWDWGINIDGTTYCLEGPCDFDFFVGGNLSSLEDLPSSIDYTIFNLTDDVTVLDGLGTLTLTVTGAGSHSVTVYFNYDLDYGSNGYLNETGKNMGVPVTGLSWEIDEIGWGLLGSLGTAGIPYVGDIFDNFVVSGSQTYPYSLLDNQVYYNEFSDQSLIPPIEDTALAKSWDFDLVDGETAIITFVAGTVEPASDFYIVQKDPDSGTNVYLSSSTNQDCAGVWGGSADIDDCGTCDSDPTNDCTGKPFPWIMFLNIIVNGTGAKNNEIEE